MSQHRLAHVQLINWGTFGGAWSFDVPWKGMLLTGPSGAGKSSVLDAMASILVAPGKVRFNAAAQGTDTRDHDRSLVTYVRGAHKREADEETGEVGAAFLRKGPTWSAVGLTFVDESGKETTLLRLFHISGSSVQRDELRSMYAIAPGRVDLLELKSFVANGIEYRQLKSSFPAWNTYRGEGYSSFAERFRKQLGIASEQAQVLLHKTQSAKNLTNLDALFRDFMLDVPGTFELANTTVEQFDELRSAHSSVVDARRQVEALLPLRAIDEQLRAVESQQREVQDQVAHLETWLRQRRKVGLEADLVRERPLLARLEAEVAEAKGHADLAEDERRRCQQAVDGAGGGDVTTLEALRAARLDARDLALQRRSRYAGAAERVAVRLPDGVAEVVRFEREVDEARAALEARRAEFNAAQGEALRDKGRGADAHRRAVDELEALRRHRSNLDARLLAVRESLAQALGVSPTTLPFVGELLQVKQGESEWTGAVERVLASFARTLVVPAQHYLAAAEFIDAEFLGTRLVYERVEPRGEDGPDFVADLLPSKLDLADGAYTGWLAERLQRRFAYACVDDARSLDGVQRGVTRNGQVKHSPSLHEKDDRFRVADRTRWVLGFSTEAKEAELERVLAVSQTYLDQIEARLRQLDVEQADLAVVARALQDLAELSWDRVDLSSHEAGLDAVDRQLERLRATNVDLRALEAQLDRARRAKQLADDKLAELRASLLQREDHVARILREVETLTAILSEAPDVPDEVAKHLDLLSDELMAEASGLDAAMRQHLHERDSKLSALLSRVSQQAVLKMTAYKKEWEAPAADWDAGLLYLPEYLGRLSTLEADRLPEFEERFFELLHRQARNNISGLAQDIRGARREIRSRVDDVNRSLLMTRFSREGRLQIKVLDRTLDEVDQFLKTLNRITESSMLDAGGAADDAARREAEERFVRMEQLLDRLGSADPADKAWRERCLDTRQHVQFQARVIDDDGAQVDVYTGSGGRSGGERQKLVTFCLAAALRFQLAPEGKADPTYALVVIDEAFDKADHTFTQAGLEVFRTFGFQLLLATPMKMLQTIDDYVGGVVMVDNRPGRGSILQELHYDLGRPAVVAADADQEVLL